MSLLDIASAIAAQMLAADPTLTPPFEFGANMLSVDRSSPVIVYVPMAESIGPAVGQGGDGISSPRPLFTRKISVAAHLWGEDVPSVELMLNAFVQAIHITLSAGSYQLSGGRWATAADVVTNWGVEFTLNMLWFIPITRAVDTYAAVNTLPISQEIVTVIS